MSQQLIYEILRMHGYRVPSPSRIYESSPQSRLIASRLRFGIEVELENVLSDDTAEWELIGNFWAVKGDGSLRNGLEFVFKQPYYGENLLRALNDLNQFLLEHDQEYRNCITTGERTSVHVHMDIRELTFDELINLVLCYICFERLLFKIAGGAHRYKNIHCKPLVDSSWLDTWPSLIKGDDRAKLEVLRGMTDRYSACNLQSIIKFGSIEFRHHEGTKDCDRILKWINILSCIYNYSKWYDCSSLLELENPIETVFNGLIDNDHDNNALVDIGKIDLRQYLNSTTFTPATYTRVTKIKSRLNNFINKKTGEYPCAV